jgi:hypothetical protein
LRNNKLGTSRTAGGSADSAKKTLRLIRIGEAVACPIR